MTKINSKEVKLFLENVDEQIQTLEDNLILLEKNSFDISVLNKLFRAAHTLKGSSATFGHEIMVQVTHSLESVFEALRENKISVSQKVIDILLLTVDILRTIRDEIEEGRENSININEIICKLKGLFPQDKKIDEYEKPHRFLLSEEEKQYLASQEVKGKILYKIFLTLNEDAKLPSVRIIIILEELKNYGEIIATIPDMKELVNSEDCFSAHILFLSEEAADKIKNIVFSFAETKAVEVNITFVDELDKDEKEESKEQTIEQTIQEKYKSFRVETKKTLRVDVEKMENLMNITSELVIEKNKLIRLANVISTKYEDDKEATMLLEIKEQLDKKINILQDEIMKARMVPLDVIFNKFPRMIRDLSAKLGKEVNFIVSGADVEIDKTVIEEISDPLIHLLRNAVDHGIKQKGEIKLTARQSESSVFIEVEDNGGGINIEEIKRIALEKNIINQAQLATLSKQEVINLIFAPNFSTADEVTETSGRGVGLDIVKANIERIQGTITVETKEGVGTKFILKIPLTLAIIKALIVSLANEVFAIPFFSVYEILEINKSDIQTIKKKEAILFRGNVLPLVRLDKILGIENFNTLNSKSLKVVVAFYFDKKVGLIIDNLLGEAEIPVYPLSKFIGEVPGISGATIDAEGKVVLILDIPSLIKEYFEGVNLVRDESPFVVEESQSTVAAAVEQFTQQINGARHSLLTG